MANGSMRDVSTPHAWSMPIIGSASLYASADAHLNDSLSISSLRFKVSNRPRPRSFLHGVWLRPLHRLSAFGRAAELLQQLAHRNGALVSDGPGRVHFPYDVNFSRAVSEGRFDKQSSLFNLVQGSSPRLIGF